MSTLTIKRYIGPLAVAVLLVVGGVTLGPPLWGDPASPGNEGDWPSKIHDNRLQLVKEVEIISTSLTKTEN